MLGKGEVVDEQIGHNAISVEENLIFHQIERDILTNALGNVFGKDSKLVNAGLNSLFGKMTSTEEFRPRWLPVEKRHLWHNLALVWLESRRQIPTKADGGNGNSSQASSSGSGDASKETKRGLKLHVDFEMDSYFAKVAVPAFSVTLVQADGQAIPRRIKDGRRMCLSDMRVKLSVWNKWADVSHEVIPDTDQILTLKDGHCPVDNLVFTEISLKHGGSFTLVVEPIDHKASVQWWSRKGIIIQSVKTHCNRKRKRN